MTQKSMVDRMDRCFKQPWWAANKHNLQGQGWKPDEPISEGFKVWSCCVSKSGCLYEFDMYLEKKGNTQSGLGELFILSLCGS